jgi:hypothetical protein
LLIRSYGAVTATRKPVILRNRLVRTNRATKMADIHITPLSGTSIDHGVLLMFNLLPDSGEGAHSRETKKSAAKTARKKSSKKSSRRRK